MLFVFQNLVDFTARIKLTIFRNISKRFCISTAVFADFKIRPSEKHNLKKIKIKIKRHNLIVDKYTFLFKKYLQNYSGLVYICMCSGSQHSILFAQSYPLFLICLSSIFSINIFNWYSCYCCG